MQIHVYQVQGYSVLRPALGSPLEKVWGRGNIIKKEESEVQRKMLGDMELHIVRSNRKVEKGKRLLLFLWRAEILFKMVYFSEICTFCSCIQVWTRESSSFSSFLSTMYHSLCFLSYKISTSSYYTREPQKNLQSQAFWAWYGLWWMGSLCNTAPKRSNAPNWWCQLSAKISSVSPQHVTLDWASDWDHLEILLCQQLFLFYVISCNFSPWALWPP